MGLLLMTRWAVKKGQSENIAFGWSGSMLCCFASIGSVTRWGKKIEKVNIIEFTANMSRIQWKTQGDVSGYCTFPKKCFLWMYLNMNLNCSPKLTFYALSTSLHLLMCHITFKFLIKNYLFTMEIFTFQNLTFF